VHLVGFITKKFVTMHGHLNVKRFKRVGTLINIDEQHQGSPRITS